MAIYNFNKDTKSTIWYRECFSVEADTIEQAKEKAIKIAENVNASFECHVLFDTAEDILPEENDNQATQELYLNHTHDELVWDNTKKSCNTQ